MKIFRTGVILALFSCGMLFSGCVGSKNANLSAAPANTASENTNSAKTNVEELGLLVNIPYEAEDIVWKESADRKQIIAVLRFAREDADNIVAEATARQEPQNASLSTETWFPAELIAQGEQNGEDILNGLAYTADIFFQPPYMSGRIVRIERTDYFVLELSAK